ncbi:MAG TPA: hypothetical protein VFD95_07060 [Usitatibacter sp.]|jgi:hypothetical protein|nr:hypothetical protein [Usitatibacter sp.]
MGIKDWFGGDKKKQAYRDKVKEAVSDGKLSSTDMQELNKLRTELDVTDAADDKTSLRRDLYNEAVDAARSKGQLTQTGLQDLQKIQKFLALRDDQVEKTKVEVNRLRMLTEIRKGNLPVVSPTNVALRGVQLEAGETPHYSLAVLIMDQGRLSGANGMEVLGPFKYEEGASRSHFLPEEGAKPLGEGIVLLTDKRLILKTADGRTASVRYGGEVPFYLYNEGLRLTKTMGNTLLKFKTLSDDTTEIVGALLSMLTRPDAT